MERKVTKEDYIQNVWLVPNYRSLPLLLEGFWSLGIILTQNKAPCAHSEAFWGLQSSNNSILCLLLRHWNQWPCLLGRTRHIKRLGLAVPSCFIRGTSSSDDFYFYFCHCWHTYFVVSVLPLKAIKKSELSSYGLGHDFSKHHCVGTLVGKRPNACISIQLGCCQATALRIAVSVTT